MLLGDLFVGEVFSVVFVEIWVYTLRQITIMGCDFFDVGLGSGFVARDESLNLARAEASVFLYVVGNFGRDRVQGR